MYKKSKKTMVFVVIVLFVGMNIIPSMGGHEAKKQCMVCSKTSHIISAETLESKMSVNLSISKTSTSIDNNLPDLVPIELRAWWGSLNNTGVFVEYDVNNIGNSYYSNESIVSNLSFFADDNTTSFGYALQSPLFYPTVWYNGEILGGCCFYELDEKPNTITAKVDFTNLIPELNEGNNDLSVSVLHGVTISGMIYENKNGEIIPFEGKIELNQYDENSLNDFGYRHYWSDENGHYNMSLCPKESLDESHPYYVMACDTTKNLKILKETRAIEYGGNAALDFIFDGVPPNKPDRPCGRKIGRIDKNYSFISFTDDPDGDEIYYKFNWGDGTFSDWLGPYDSNEKINVSHAWNKPDTYLVKVVSKDSLGMLSEWSPPSIFNVPKAKQPLSSMFLLFLEKLIEQFPLLEQMLFYGSYWTWF